MALHSHVKVQVESSTPIRVLLLPTTKYNHHRLSRYQMSTTVSPNESPASVQPLHNPSQAAYIVVPQAPLGNANTNAVNANAPGMGVKALLAKKMAKSQ